MSSPARQPRERHAATVGCFFRLGLKKLLSCVKIGKENDNAGGGV